MEIRQKKKVGSMDFNYNTGVIFNKTTQGLFSYLGEQIYAKQSKLHDQLETTSSTDTYNFCPIEK